jgi:hypothetical protein
VRAKEKIRFKKGKIPFQKRKNSVSEKGKIPFLKRKNSVLEKEKFRFLILL